MGVTRTFAVVLAAHCLWQRCDAQGTECADVWEPLPDLPSELAELSGGVVTREGAEQLCLVGERSDMTFCYSADSDAWQTPSIPPERPSVGNHHCTVMLDGSMYLIGGFGSELAFQKFDGSSWTLLESPPPIGTGSASCAEYNGDIFMCGGIEGINSKPGKRSTTRKCFRYNVASASWKTAGQLNQAVNHAAYCKVGTMMVIAGGRGGGNTPNQSATNRCQQYNLKKKAKGPDCSSLPIPIAGNGACVSYNDPIKGQLVLVMGGELGSVDYATHGEEYGSGGGVLNAVFVRLGSSSSPWVRLVSMPTGKHGIMPVEMGGYIYVVGGGVKAGFSGSKTGFRANLSTLTGCLYEDPGE